MAMTAAPASSSCLIVGSAAADAAVVLDVAGLLVERHVEIDADQDLLALQVAQVVDGLLGHRRIPRKSSHR